MKRSAYCSPAPSEDRSNTGLILSQRADSDVSVEHKIRPINTYRSCRTESLQCRSNNNYYEHRVFQKSSIKRETSVLKIEKGHPSRSADHGDVSINILVERRLIDSIHGVNKFNVMCATKKMTRKFCKINRLFQSLDKSRERILLSIALLQNDLQLK